MAPAKGYKAVGGVESVALYPTQAVVAALFSSEGCEVEWSGESPIKVTLMDDASRYEECSECKNGIHTVAHLLHLVAERGDADKWLTNDFVEQASLEGFVGVVSLCNGHRLLVGYSAEFKDEQPLRLESLTSSSGSRLAETPTVTLRLIAHDTDFSQEIL